MNWTVFPSDLCRQRGESTKDHQGRIARVVKEHGFDRIAAVLLAECVENECIRIGRIEVFRAVIAEWSRSE